MVEATETTAEQIRSTLSDESHIDPARLADADLHVVVPDSDVGQFFRAVREVGAETDTFRSGDHIRGYVTLPEE